MFFFYDDTPIYSTINSSLTNIVSSRFQISIPESYKEDLCGPAGLSKFSIVIET